LWRFASDSHSDTSYSLTWLHINIPFHSLAFTGQVSIDSLHMFSSTSPWTWDGPRLKVSTYAWQENRRHNSYPRVGSEPTISTTEPYVAGPLSPSLHRNKALQNFSYFFTSRLIFFADKRETVVSSIRPSLMLTRFSF
jgi:hypothetical protein